MDVMQPLKTHVYCLFTFYEVIYMYVTLKKEKYFEDPRGSHSMICFSNVMICNI